MQKKHFLEIHFLQQFFLKMQKSLKIHVFKHFLDIYFFSLKNTLINLLTNIFKYFFALTNCIKNAKNVLKNKCKTLRLFDRFLTTKSRQKAARKTLVFKKSTKSRFFEK